MQNKLSERIINHKFEPVRSGFGVEKPFYNRAAVDAYLQNISLEVEQIEKNIKQKDRTIELLETKQSLVNEMKTLSDEEISDIQKNLMDREEKVISMEKSLRRLMIMAQKDSEALKKEARKEAEKIILEAKKQAESLYEKAKVVHEEASQEANSMINEAKERLEMINTRYQETEDELIVIRDFIDKKVLSKKGLNESISSVKTKQALVSNNA